MINEKESQLTIDNLLKRIRHLETIAVGPVTAPILLLETGDALLLESGDEILLE